MRRTAECADIPDSELHTVGASKNAQGTMTSNEANRIAKNVSQKHACGMATRSLALSRCPAGSGLPSRVKPVLHSPGCIGPEFIYGCSLVSKFSSRTFAKHNLLI